jgi:hypothetical protein
VWIKGLSNNLSSACRSNFHPRFFILKKWGSFKMEIETVSLDVVVDVVA